MVVEFHSEAGEIQKVFHPNEPPKREPEADLSKI